MSHPAHICASPYLPPSNSTLRLSLPHFYLSFLGCGDRTDYNLLNDSNGEPLAFAGELVANMMLEKLPQFG
jgi:hypothetical protein